MPTHSKIQSGQSTTGFSARLQEGLHGRYAIERGLGEGGMAVVFVEMGPAAQMPIQETSEI